MSTPVFRDEPLPPADVGRLNDFYQHTGAVLVLLAKGGRVHSCRPRAAATVSRRARRLLLDLARLLATIQDTPAAPSPPAPPRDG